MTSPQPQLQPVSLTHLPVARADIASALSTLAAAGVVTSTRELDRLAYATDLSPSARLLRRQGRTPPLPDGVCWPTDEAAVEQVVRWARSYRVPLIAFGSGTGVSQATWASRGAVVVDLKRLNRGLAIDEHQRTVTVSAGTTGEVLERGLNARGYTLGWRVPGLLMPSTVGAWLATRHTPFESLANGSLSDRLVGFRAVTGSGETVELWSDEGPLTELLLGSEGTLAMFTQATLRIHRLPLAEQWRTVTFDSRLEALHAMRVLLDEGLQPAFFELADATQTATDGSLQSLIGVHRQPPGTRGAWSDRLLPRLFEAVSRETIGRPGVVNQLKKLFSKVELHLLFTGTENKVTTSDKNALELCQRAGGDDLGSEPARQFAARLAQGPFREGSLLEMGTTTDALSVAAPWPLVEATLDRVTAACADLAVVTCRFSAASVSTALLHFTFTLAGLDDTEAIKRWETLWSRVVPAALQAGGNPWFRQPVGLKTRSARRLSLQSAQSTLQQLKRRFDPDSILCPVLSAP